MRKFKIKNKPKRKYIKKQTAPINLSVSKSALISIFPVFFITLAVFFFVSVLMRSGAQAGPIVSQTIIQHMPHYTLPHISLPALPKISVTIPSISLPTVDSRPISDFMTKVATSFLVIIRDTFFRILTFLDPLPLFSWIIHVGITLAKGLAQTTIILVQTIYNEIILSYKIALQTHERSTTLVYRGGQTIANALILSIQIISKLALQIGQAIMHEAERFGASVQRETNKTVDVMKTPFRIMAYYLELARPTFNKIGFIFKRSVIELENNAVTIFTAPSKINE